MGQSLKAIVQLFTLIAALASLVVWVFPQKPTQTEWIWRIAAPAVACALLGLLAYVDHRKDIVPDVLRQNGLSCLERDGISFAPAFTQSNGICWLNLFVQNRYERTGVIRLEMHANGTPLCPIGLEIVCEGAAVKVLRIPFAVPPGMAGEMITFDVGANTRYPAGAGRLLRFREGVRVGSLGGAHVGLTVAAAFAGAIFISNPARIRLRIPPWSAPQIPPELRASEEVLWTWEPRDNESRPLRTGDGATRT